jgi:hypothetical protein
MLLDQQVLKTPHIRRTRRQFHRRAMGHHAIQCFFGLVNGLFFLVLLILYSKFTLEKYFHLTDGVASNHRDFDSLVFKVLQCSRLPLLLGLQRQDQIRTRWCPRKRNLNMKIIRGTQKPVPADPVRVDANRFPA